MPAHVHVHVHGRVNTSCTPLPTTHPLDPWHPVQAPPWLLIGMEGFFGTLLSVLVVYPLAIYLPG